MLKVLYMRTNVWYNDIKHQFVVEREASGILLSKVESEVNVNGYRQSVQFRIYPTHEQAALIHKTIGCSRFVFNRFLALWNDQYKEIGKGLSYGACSAELTKLKQEIDWLKEPDKFALQNALRKFERCLSSLLS